MKLLIAFVMTGSFSFSQMTSAKARTRAAETNAESLLTYDLSASSGSYNGLSYTEITLGLNWVLQDWLTWRNSIFTRQGTGISAVQGIDSSARFSTSAKTEGGGLGVEAFVGPGLRFASQSNNAVFGEVGVILKLGGLRVGVGAKVLNYIVNRDDPSGSPLPRNDTQYFLVLAGGGAL